MTTQGDLMREGEWYLDEPELQEARRRCWRFLDKFKNGRPDDDGQRIKILNDLLGSFGDGAVIMPRFQFSYGTYISIGSNSFVNTDATFMDDAKITIGDDVRIGPGVQLLTALHPASDHQKRRDGWERAAPIEIQDNAWLGGGVIVCPGVTIGKNAVIGAGSVVVKDIPAQVFAAGNAAKVIRQL